MLPCIILQRQKNKINHIVNIQRIPEKEYVWLDRFTIRNLELLDNARGEGTSFITILDQTSTPMGSRLMYKWVILPLLDLHAINKGLEVVDYFVNHPDDIENTDAVLQEFGDLERLINKASMDRISPRK